MIELIVEAIIMFILIAIGISVNIKSSNKDKKIDDINNKVNKMSKEDVIKKFNSMFKP